MADKPFSEMTEAELREALATWESNVETAPGWSSAYFAATILRAIVEEGQRRGLGFINKFPIRKGAEHG